MFKANRGLHNNFLLSENCYKIRYKSRQKQDNTPTQYKQLLTTENRRNTSHLYVTYKATKYTEISHPHLDIQPNDNQVPSKCHKIEHDNELKTSTRQTG